ncbi:MAG TPA: DEAD/DEAH box helicase, partial [Thermoanaerobaculia bacterium]|nr:DEAD/DEAH box helicase [Thermoanaerobaculia bacterium]
MAIRSPAFLDPALSLFHPVVQEWFSEEVGVPTDVQRRAWPEIASGKHVLVTAPTGTGKTLTAFLWALDRFFTGALETGATRVLYVSPLKALNTDVRRNLEEPLAGLSERFRAAGLPVPGVRALVRSGDTPADERRKMVRRPPEILITTPESLNILLTSQGGRAILGAIETVILDEIHAVAGTKRGTHLITAVERLVPLSGEFQRIALSATVRPLSTVADFVGGLQAVPPAAPGTRPGEPWRYRKRPVTTVRSEA